MPRKAKLPDGEASFRHLYRSYMRSAKKRGYSFKLTVDEFRELTQGRCHYCNYGPSMIYVRNAGVTGFRYNGIDRKSSKRGYTIKNCVSACKLCNYSKQQLTTSQFKAFIRKLYKRIDQW